MRPDERRDAQIVALAAALGLSLLVRLVAPDPGPIELLPVLAAAWWLGTSAALVVGVAAGVVLVVGAIAADPFEAWTLLVRIPLTILPGYAIGRLREERGRRRRELAQLRVIQDALAPVRPPELPLLELATRYVPAERGVAGDFYLVTEGHNNATVVVVGDVVGKGIEAAKRATFVRATLTACAPYSDDPVHLLRVANAELIRQHGLSSDFITMVCVVVKPDTSVVWSTAGHPAPVSLDDGLPIGNLRPAYPLGIAPELPVVAQSTLLPRSGMLLYTDGLTDARPQRRTYEPFGRSRLTRLVAELDGPMPEEAVERLIQAAQVFAGGSLPDDVCLVALRSKLSRSSWRRVMAERWREGGGGSDGRPPAAQPPEVEPHAPSRG